MALFGSPSARVPDDVASLANEFRDLQQADQARIQRMLTYRSENQATRDVQVDLDVADLQDYGRRAATAEPRRHKIPLAFGQAITLKHSFRIANRLPDVAVDRREETQEERYRSDTMEKVVWSIIHGSKGRTQFADGAWDASQLGAACFDLYWRFDKQMPLFRAVDPAGIVVVQGVDDPHELQRVYKFWDVPVASVRATYRDKFFRDEPVQVESITDTSKPGGVEMVTLVQMCDGNKLVRFALGGNVPLLEYQHNYGFTPYVVIPNVGPERDVWGWADYEFVRALAHYIPALFSREADILRATSNGAVIEKGTGQNAEQVKAVVRAGGVLPSRKDGSVEPIQAPDVPAFHVQHAERALEMFKMLGFAPDASWGNGASGSGTDRGLQLQPLLELGAMKQANWESGLSRLFSMAYRMIEQKMTTNGKYAGAKISGHSRRSRFLVTLGPNLAPTSMPNPAHNPDDIEASALPEMIDLPRTPKELFDGEYDVRFFWQNRIDPDDPAFVLNELNKFQQGAQSLYTTLERLGFQSPEDEMKLIEEESDRFPWLRQGQIALIKAQMSGGGGQGDGGGNPGDPAGDLMNAVETTQTKDGTALNADAAGGALRGGLGSLYGGA